MRWLPKEQREKRNLRIVELRDKKHLTFRQIAEQLGMNEGRANLIYNDLKRRKEEKNEYQTNSPR